MPANDPPPLERLPLEQASTVDLVKTALDEAKELVRLEVEIAKSEVKQEIAQTKKAAIGVGIALAFGLVVLSLLAVAIVLAAGGTAGAARLFGLSMIPEQPLDTTRRRVERDVDRLEERIA